MGLRHDRTMGVAWEEWEKFSATSTQKREEPSPVKNGREKMSKNKIRNFPSSTTRTHTHTHTAKVTAQTKRWWTAGWIEWTALRASVMIGGRREGSFSRNIMKQQQFWHKKKTLSQHHNTQTAGQSFSSSLWRYFCLAFQSALACSGRSVRRKRTATADRLGGRNWISIIRFGL